MVSGEAETIGAPMIDAVKHFATVSVVVYKNRVSFTVATEA